MKKTMIIGLGPEYNYPGKYDLWAKSNTKYASNHGASLISRALIKQFNGEHIEIDEFSKVDELREKYDRCIIAFATHVHYKRDVSVYTNFIEKLKLPTYAFSLGVQDYSGNSTGILEIHSSMKRLLEIVSESAKFIGTRGPHTASILYRNGFNNVIPIGCPTMYWNLSRNHKIDKPSSYSNAGLVYHRTIIGNEGKHLINDIELIGQDFLDEVAFTDNLKEDEKLKRIELKNYTDDAFALIQKNGYFPKDFNEWFNHLKTKDFVLGPRLHGCLGSIIQGVPAVLLARDLRVREIAEFFDLPYVKYEDLHKKSSIQQIFDEADFESFNKTYQLRYDNYVNFLKENKIESNLDSTGTSDELRFNFKDITTSNAIVLKEIQEIKIELEQSREILKNAEKLHKLLGNMTTAKKIGKMLFDKNS